MIERQKTNRTGSRSQIAIRADASERIGNGHVMRCASLGMRLMAEGKSVRFISAEIEEWLSDWLQKEGFGLSILPSECVGNPRLDAQFTTVILGELANCTWVVVDHYYLGAEWEIEIGKMNKKVFVIDDFGPRRHSCDVFLNPSSIEEINLNGLELFTDANKYLLGPSFLLLRPEFDAPDRKRLRLGSIDRILIYFGGGQILDEVRKVVSAIWHSAAKNVKVTVLLGQTRLPQNFVDELLILNPNVMVVSHTFDMANLIYDADLGVGTCGVSAWERCVLGLPSLTVITSENQRRDAVYLDRLGAVKNLGVAAEVDESTWSKEIENLFNDQSKVLQMSKACYELDVVRSDSQKRLFDIFDQQGVDL